MTTFMQGDKNNVNKLMILLETLKTPTGTTPEYVNIKIKIFYALIGV